MGMLGPGPSTAREWCEGVDCEGADWETAGDGEGEDVEGEAALGRRAGVERMATGERLRVSTVGVVVVNVVFVVVVVAVVVFGDLGWRGWSLTDCEARRAIQRTLLVISERPLLKRESAARAAASRDGR